MGSSKEVFKEYIDSSQIEHEYVGEGDDQIILFPFTTTKNGFQIAIIAIIQQEFASMSEYYGLN